MDSREQTKQLLEDGSLRTFFGDSFEYSAEGRYKCAMHDSQLCKLLADQEITVVSCTISYLTA